MTNRTAEDFLAEALRIVRLDDVIRCALTHGVDDRRRRVTSREHDDLYVRMRDADSLERFKTVHPRHRNVEEHDIRRRIGVHSLQQIAALTAASPDLGPALDRESGRGHPSEKELSFTTGAGGVLAGSAWAGDLDVKHWQLFIDDHAIVRGTGLDRVVHHPRAMGVVIDADKPWETHSVQPNYFCRKSDGTFLGYYSAHWWIPNTDARSASLPDVLT